MDNPAKQAEIGHLVQDLLAYHRVCGITTYPRNQAIKAFLSQNSGPATKKIIKEQGPDLAYQELAAKEKTQPPQEAVPPAAAPSLDEIIAEIESCKACELHGKRLVPVSGQGRGGSIRLMIVGEWLYNLKAPGETDAVFGLEEDQMLGRMLGAIKIPAEQVFITNIVKCGVGPSITPQARHARSCLYHLRRQILAVRPELICTMGSLASRTLLETEIPLSRLRGTFHRYRLDQNNTIALVATYHPHFLLENAEMKGAAWTDLQQLARRLGLKTAAG